MQIRWYHWLGIIGAALFGTLLAAGLLVGAGALLFDYWWTHPVNIPQRFSEILAMAKTAQTGYWVGWGLIAAGFAIPFLGIFAWMAVSLQQIRELLDPQGSQAAEMERP